MSSDCVTVVELSLSYHLSLSSLLSVARNSSIIERQGGAQPRPDCPRRRAVKFEISLLLGGRLGELENTFMVFKLLPSLPDGLVMARSDNKDNVPDIETSGHTTTTTITRQQGCRQIGAS